MAQTTTPKLDAGDRFPVMDIAMIDGSTQSLPADLSSENTILLIYRGKW